MKNIAIIISTAVTLLLGAASAFATPIDLTKAANSSIYAGITATDGSIWRVSDSHPTGTGVYGPFLRLQNNGTESGLNTDGNAKSTYYDKGGIWTHSVTFGELAVISNNNNTYYGFTLDINEPANSKDRYLSLDSLNIYAYNGTIGGYATNTSESGVAKYSFNSTVLLDYSLSSSGSGSDDMAVLIPTSYFAGVQSTDFLYLYSLFGSYGTDQVQTGVDKKGHPVYQTRDFGSAGGFEEWAYVAGATPPPLSPDPVPEPGTMMLLGVGMAGLAIYGKRRANKA